MLLLCSDRLIPSFLPSPSDPRGLCDSILPFLRHRTSGPSSLGAAKRAHGIVLVESRTGLTSSFGWAIHPRGLRWIQALMTAHGGQGGIVREVCPGEASGRFPEWLILDDVHHSQSHAVPFCFLDKVLLLQDQLCLANHTDAV
ncbi:hypothetical protein CI238_03993 [Colletotrichum incanum]|uniref:Uncharacterized protein n=1 Tax=Colletotrichum incanum TaxID=1573173 RepID=A0A162Q4U9_COLIC|nr:hypothetical protein CI238_03993 [Colletotrichum incanum]